MNPIGQPFIVLPSIDSTNIYAMGQFHARLARHGTAYLAMQQTQGRGQRNRQWISAPGQNLLLSVLLEPANLLPLEQFHLSAMVAISCYELFKKYAGSDTRIKWPNDLYWSDRKAGGILIENILTGREWTASIVGIGINVNQTHFDAELQNPVSLKQITGRSQPVETLARELCDILEKGYNQLIDGKRSEFLEQYNKALFKRGERIYLKSGGRRVNGTLREVDADGRLVVVTGVEERFGFGDVEWLLQQPLQ